MSTRGMQELERYIEHQPNICVVDPLNNVYPVLDRLKYKRFWLVWKISTCKVVVKPGPHIFSRLTISMNQRLLEAKLTPPSIVKPRVACGVADAYSMGGSVRNLIECQSLTCADLVVKHVKVDAAEKTYNNSLLKLSEKNGLKPLLFDSLKSLPTAKENQDCGVGEDCKKANHRQMDPELVADAACWLRKKLDLTIFGFNVVILEKSGDHVILDLNYLPSFKELPDNIAIPAFWKLSGAIMNRQN